MPDLHLPAYNMHGMGNYNPGSRSDAPAAFAFASSAASKVGWWAAANVGHFPKSEGLAWHGMTREKLGIETVVFHTRGGGPRRLHIMNLGGSRSLASHTRRRNSDVRRGSQDRVCC